MYYKDSIDIFLLYIMSYCSKETVEYYKINLRMFSNYLMGVKGSLKFDVNEIKKVDYVGYIAHCRGKGIKNVSVRTYARAVKVYLRYCYNEGYMLENVTLNVKVPKSDRRLIMPLNSKEVTALRRYAGKSPCYKRDWCIIGLMIDCGLRLEEVVGLNIDDIDYENNTISIINSKNNKSRIVPLPSGLRQDIENYRSYCVTHYNYNGCTALILNRSYNKRISHSSIKIMFSRLKECVPRVHAHLLRHTFATSFILGGGTLEVLRVLMGHADYNVTKEYLHIASQMRLTDFDIYKLDEVYFRVYNYRKT